MAFRCRVRSRAHQRRWRTRPPAEFISLAEVSGLIIPIGKWVIAEACRQTAEWHKLKANDGRPPISVSVNLSSRQLENPDLIDHVAEALLRSRIEPGRVTLEITESLLMQHTELSIRKLRELRDLGVGLAIDNFGTGYSSLSYLRRFPVDVLKFDKSFIDGIEDDREAETLVRAIGSLGRALGLRLVAEGIEHERLREMGCERVRAITLGCRSRPSSSLRVSSSSRPVWHVG
jgi:EAL domain-containing protein (putative c-di-GMP-specific phosphodiesterase class I)